jgi:hypothetical protein
MLQVALDHDILLAVAASRGLAAEFADRLHGETREEVEQDADKLIRSVRPMNMDALIRRAARGQELSVSDVDDMDALIRRAAGRG